MSRRDSIVPAGLDRPVPKYIPIILDDPDNDDYYDVDGRPGVEYPDSGGNDIHGDEWLE
jgi:hypothetical protein